MKINLVLFLFCTLVSTGVCASALEKMTGEVNLFEQRTLYLQAKKSYEKGDFNTYQALTQQLNTYPLYPYLVALALNDSLTSLPYYEVDQFLRKNNDTVIGRRVLANWLTVLAEKKHWHDFRSYYSATIRSTRLQCISLWARIKTGDKSAFKKVGALWDVKQSQPDECDPIFNEWIKNGYLTEARLWSRYKKAVAANQHGLVRYLTTFANKKTQPFFNLLKNVHNNPAQINQIKHFSQNNEYTNDIIKYGLIRLQSRNFASALAIYKKFEQQNRFDNDFKELFLSRNQRNEIRALSLNDLDGITQLTPLVTNKASIPTFLLKAVREQNWSFYLTWYEQLSLEEQDKDQWRYWQARALEATTVNEKAKVIAAYTELAQRRGYYGFLAADRLKQPYTLSDKPLNIDNNLLLEVNHIPAIARARELFFTDSIRDARREWRDGTQGLSALAVQASAKLANEWGWHRKAIEMLTSIKAWDHLAIRFPVIHRDLIEQKAKRFDYSPSLIYAIARQESAWQKDATSSAGARGLMQLIPSTAKDAAKKVGVKHQKSQLYLPEHNILLGSFHMNELLERYNNNRLLAIAAYNAGQSRVNRWVEKSNGTLPHDVWVETIPFKETRQYVKNVLYYSALYDYRSGNEMSLLTTSERNTLL